MIEYVLYAAIYIAIAIFHMMLYNRRFVVPRFDGGADERMILDIITVLIGLAWPVTLLVSVTIILVGGLARLMRDVGVLR